MKAMTPGDEIATSFVARIWLERVPDGKAAWRGHIRHVQSERECYFRAIGEMREFIDSVSGAQYGEPNGEDDDNAAAS